MSEHHHCHCPCHAHECEHEHHHEAHECHEHFDKVLIEMADQAWMEVLKEKIKEQIKATSSTQLDKLAKLVAESNQSRWDHKLLQQKELTSFKEKLFSLMHGK